MASGILSSETYAGAGERKTHPRGEAFRNFFEVMLFSTGSCWERDVLRGSKEVLWAKWRDMPEEYRALEKTSLLKAYFGSLAVAGPEAVHFKKFYCKLTAGLEQTWAKDVLIESFHYLWGKWRERAELDYHQEVSEDDDC